MNHSITNFSFLKKIDIIRLFTLLLIIFSPVKDLNAQNRKYAREIVDTLASSHFEGRGYVNKGDSKAAEYIANEFDRINLSKFGSSYFQSFNTSVNTFPDRLVIGINDEPLVPGVDYLVSPGCPKVIGEFKVLELSVEDILDVARLIIKINKAENRFFSIDLDANESLTKKEQNAFQNNLNILKYATEIEIKGLLLITSQKLTWSVSPVQDSRPIVTVRKGALSDKIKSVIIDVNAEMIQDYSTQNVIGYLPGLNEDSVILFTAHYDHLGKMGSKTYFPGANDNASGIAMLLTLAEHFATLDSARKYTMVFIAFGAEEIGLKGSLHYTKNPVFPMNKIKFLINMDISGTGDDGIQVVNGSVYQDKFDMLTSINKEQALLANVKIRGEACNSDHCPFYQQGVPSFFIYTLGGIQAYHDIYDKSETLPLTAYENYFKLLSAFVERL